MLACLYRVCSTRICFCMEWSHLESTSPIKVLLIHSRRLDGNHKSINDTLYIYIALLTQDVAQRETNNIQITQKRNHFRSSSLFSESETSRLTVASCSTRSIVLAVEYSWEIIPPGSPWNIAGNMDDFHRPRSCLLLTEIVNKRKMMPNKISILNVVTPFTQLYEGSSGTGQPANWAFSHNVDSGGQLSLVNVTLTSAPRSGFQHFLSCCLPYSIAFESLNESRYGIILSFPE